MWLIWGGNNFGEPFKMIRLKPIFFYGILFCCDICVGIPTIHAESVNISSQTESIDTSTQPVDTPSKDACDKVYAIPYAEYKEQDFETLFKCSGEYYPLLSGNLNSVSDANLQVGKFTATDPLSKYDALNELLLVCMATLDANKSCVLDSQTDEGIQTVFKYMLAYWRKYNKFPPVYVNGLKKVYAQQMETTDEQWHSPFLVLALIHAYKSEWAQADKYINDYKKVIEENNVQDVSSGDIKTVKGAVQWLKYVIKTRNIKSRLPGETEFQKGAAYYLGNGVNKDSTKALYFFKQSFKKQYFKSGDVLAEMLKLDLKETLMAKSVTIYGTMGNKVWGLEMILDDSWEFSPTYTRKEFFGKVLQIVNKYDLPIGGIEVTGWSVRKNIVYSKTPWDQITFGGDHIRVYPVDLN